MEHLVEENLKAVRQQMDLACQGIRAQDRGREIVVGDQNRTA